MIVEEKDNLFQFGTLLIFWANLNRFWVIWLANKIDLKKQVLKTT